MQIHYFNTFIKISLLFIVLLLIGLPINNPYKFVILLFFLPIIIFSKVNRINNKKLLSLIIIFVFFLYKFLTPSLYIQEGHNIVLLTENSYEYYKKNLPIEVFNFFEDEYEKIYALDKCDKKNSVCWKSFKPKSDSPIYANSNDWSLNDIKYSRIVSGFNFFDLTSAKIGIVNDLNFHFYANNSINDLTRDNFPFFVMFEIPKELVDSSICWKGNIFWEKEYKIFNQYTNSVLECEKFSKNDFGKKIYITSVDNNIKFKINKNLFIKFFEILDKILLFLTIIIILFLNLKVNYKIYLYSFLYLLAYILLLFFINKQLFYGFDIFPGGMDGMIYLTYSNIIYENLLNYNFYEALKGAEAVFFFPSSLRYFWALSKFIFGESFYGYLLIPFFYTGLIFYILNCLVGFKWSLIITGINFFTNAFDGYALPNMKMINHINVGHAEPLAIFFVLLGICLMCFLYNSKIFNNSRFYNFLLGFILFLAVSLRPNYLPTAFILIMFFTFYNFYNHSSIKIYIFAIIGFSFLLLIPFHNYIYGNRFVLFSSGYKYNTGVPLTLYFKVFFDLLLLNYNENINIILNQIERWIKPQDIHYILSILIMFFLMIRKNHYLVKVICLLAFSQHLVLLVYEPEHRYAYLAWILTIILNIYFFKTYIVEKIYFRIKNKF